MGYFRDLYKGYLEKKRDKIFLEIQKGLRKLPDYALDKLELEREILEDKLSRLEKKSKEAKMADEIQTEIPRRYRVASMGRGIPTPSVNGREGYVAFEGFQIIDEKTSLPVFGISSDPETGIITGDWFSRSKSTKGGRE